MVLPGATDALVPGTTGAVSISSSMPETGAGNDKIRAPSVPVNRTSAADIAGFWFDCDGCADDSTDEGLALVGSPSEVVGVVSPLLTVRCLAATWPSWKCRRLPALSVRRPGRIRRRAGRPIHQSSRRYESRFESQPSRSAFRPHL